MSPTFKTLALAGALFAAGAVAAAASASPVVRVAGNIWYVDGVHGSNKNSCKSPQDACKTITRAISLSASGDSVRVAAGVYRENLLISHDLILEGSGAAKTIIDGGGVSSDIIAGTPDSVVVVAGFTLRHGGGRGDGGAIYNCMSVLTVMDSVLTGNAVRPGNGSLGYGGAIYNCPDATLTITNSTFSKNSADAGGAICNGGQLTILNSTFSDNVARHARGGGAIFNYGLLELDNSTISGNRVPAGSGGGIDNGTLVGLSGSVTISSSTISDNVALRGRGGGIFTLAGVLTTTQDTIIAGNTGGNCSGAITSQGYNLSSDHSCSLNGAGDKNGASPRLGPLRDNGGPTHTMALLAGSPAIDAGNPSGCFDGRGALLPTDQRGSPRPDREDKAGCDIGAFERLGD